MLETEDMRTKQNKVIVDTNLFISFLISKKLSYLDEILLSSKTKLVFSNDSLGELLEVVVRPKFAKYFKDEDIYALFKMLDKHALIFKVKSDVKLCRDPKDNFLLSLAKDSKADFLLTGDKDLLEVAVIGHTNIITIADFKKFHLIK